MPKKRSGSKAKARKRSKGFSAKNKNSQAHKTHKRRQKQHEKTNRKTSEKQRKQSEKQERFQERQNKTKRQHEKKVSAIQENEDLLPSEKSDMQRKELHRRSMELHAERQEELQLRRETREIDIHDREQRLFIEEDYRRRKLPYQYVQARGVYYPPSFAMGYAQSSIPLPREPPLDGIPNPYHRRRGQQMNDDDDVDRRGQQRNDIDDDNDGQQKNDVDDDEGEKEEKDESASSSSSQPSPSMRALPDPANIAALSNIDPTVARKFLILREAVYTAHTVASIQEASTRFALFTEQLDRVFHAHMNIYVQVLKYRPRSWTLERAGSFVDNLSEDDLSHLLDIKKNDLHDYLLALK